MSNSSSSPTFTHQKTPSNTFPKFLFFQHKKKYSPSPQQKKTHMFQTKKNFSSTCVGHNKIKPPPFFVQQNPTSNPPVNLTKKTLQTHLCPGFQILGARHSITEIRIPKPRDGFADIRNVVRKIQGCWAQHQGQHQRQESTQQCKST